MPRTKELTEKRKKRFEPSQLVPTGSTLLNLCMSEQKDGAHLIGDSHAGKTFLSLTMLAEIANHDEFEDYFIIYDDVENANSFDMVELFGEETSNRIVPPSEDEDKPFSETMEDFIGNFQDCVDSGQPFIYVLDSLDALDTKADQKKRNETIEANRKGKDVAGSYGMAKPKMLSENLRGMISSLSKSGSILIIVSQTRDDINPMTMTKKTRSGGRALKFYASFEMWMAVRSKLKKGGISKIKISKNKVTGKVREIPINLYYDYGIDNIRGNIEWLLENSTVTGWSKPKKAQKFTAPEFGFDDSKTNATTMQNLINHIEENNLEEELSEVVEGFWNQIEDGLRINKGRKRKYK